MAVDPDIEGSLNQLREHLASQVALKQRESDFDMDDAAEAHLLSSFSELQTALLWLAGNVQQPWHDADHEAMRSHSRHRQLAHIAIVTGTAAIVLAVVQLSIKLTFVRLTSVALVLEAIAVTAAFVAVVVGLRTKFDRRWLGQRHCAERLRMLKFRALEQLWCRDQVTWQRWVEDQLVALKHADNFAEVERWSRGGEVEPDIPVSANCELDSSFARALTIYYRFKRLDFQANYFKRRRETYERQSGGWQHLSLPLFLVSVVFVLAHFAAELRANRLEIAGLEQIATFWKAVAVWCVALAAVIPIIGAGVRAWFAAFELPRSASLFAAKHQALLHAVKHFEEDSGDVLATLRHMAQTEHFLEHEHREWLRLLLDTEWFL